MKLNKEDLLLKVGRKIAMAFAEEVGKGKSKATILLGNWGVTDVFSKSN